jgi:hypothetical protein
MPPKNRNVFASAQDHLGRENNEIEGITTRVFARRGNDLFPALVPKRASALLKKTPPGVCFRLCQTVQTAW